MLSTVTISALPFSGVMASTGMIIWALIGLVAMLTGLVTVVAARRRSRLAKPTVTAAPENTVPQTTPAAETGQDSLTQAA